MTPPEILDLRKRVVECVGPRIKPLGRHTSSETGLFVTVRVPYGPDSRDLCRYEAPVGTRLSVTGFFVFAGGPQTK